MELTGNDCRIARRRRGLTKREIATALRVSPQRVGQIEAKVLVVAETYNRYVEAVENAHAEKMKAEYAPAGGAS